MLWVSRGWGTLIIISHGYDQCKSYCGFTTTDMNNTVGLHPYECPPDLKVMKHFLYIKYGSTVYSKVIPGCVMSIKRAGDTNHNIPWPHLLQPLLWNHWNLGKSPNSILTPLMDMLWCSFFFEPNFHCIIITLSIVGLNTQKWFLDHLKNWLFLGNTSYQISDL